MTDIIKETSTSRDYLRTSESTVINAQDGIGKITIEPSKYPSEQMRDLFLTFAPRIIRACLQDKPEILQKKDTRILMRRNIADRPKVISGGLLIDHKSSHTIVINLNLIDRIASIQDPAIASPHIQALFILAHELEEQAWRYKETLEGRDIQTVKVRNGQDLPSYNKTPHEIYADKAALNSLHKVFGVKYKLDPDKNIIFPDNR